MTGEQDKRKVSHLGDDYLKRAEFFEYMGDFRSSIERRLATLEENQVQKQNPQSHQECSPYKEKLIVLLVGALLALVGVGTGVFL